MRLKWAKDIIGVEKSSSIVKYRFFFLVALQFMNIIALLLISPFDFWEIYLESGTDLFLTLIGGSLVRTCVAVIIKMFSQFCIFISSN